LVDTKKIIFQVEIELEIPSDIVHDRYRLKSVEDGITKSIGKGLYEQGVSYRIKNVKFRQ
jgi:hypothetical protein